MELNCMNFNVDENILKKFNELQKEVIKMRDSLPKDTQERKYYRMFSTDLDKVFKKYLKQSSKNNKIKFNKDNLKES